MVLAPQRSDVVPDVPDQRRDTLIVIVKTHKIEGAEDQVNVEAGVYLIIERILSVKRKMPYSVDILIYRSYSPVKKSFDLNKLQQE